MGDGDGGGQRPPEAQGLVPDADDRAPRSEHRRMPVDVPPVPEGRPEVHEGR
ncbi:hypothetical protein KCH_07870 [Kitasatospora cheerisanensis KCTC 2395]|uniref:Uncharacterized protein n=1 Tax=Kitasatospora cheerisanensis KCTC 2395 TaxID=1348663 RepID=A0A066ZB88_9ACTN|nr:hypothetical protein KCH_07870 [Kitasatospora cheerisanensis KCTC 2395]